MLATKALRRLRHFGSNSAPNGQAAPWHNFQTEVFGGVQQAHLERRPNFGGVREDHCWVHDEVLFVEIFSLPFSQSCRLINGTNSPIFFSTCTDWVSARDQNTDSIHWNHSLETSTKFLTKYPSTHCYQLPALHCQSTSQCCLIRWAKWSRRRQWNLDCHNDKSQQSPSKTFASSFFKPSTGRPRRTKSISNNYRTKSAACGHSPPKDKQSSQSSREAI